MTDNFVAPVFRQLGTHSKDERQNEDFYSTDPQAVKDLIRMLHEYSIAIPYEIVETSVGAGHIAREFEKIGCIIFDFFANKGQYAVNAYERIRRTSNIGGGG